MSLAVTIGVLCAAGGVEAVPDEVLARAAVPNAENQVGEVRLMRRGDATVVQTVLVTRLLPRVTAEIRLKEARNWPVGGPGHADMSAYVGALDEAAARLRATLPGIDARNVDDVDRRLRLLIEFVATPTTAGVEIASFDSESEDRRYDVANRRLLAAPPVERSYVLRNMRLILADAFHLSEPDVDRLGALGPAATAP